MNRYIKISVFVLLTTCLMQSCSKDFLEKILSLGSLKKNFTRLQMMLLPG
ncbi:MAG: hypothetical protein IPN89_18955 [Saprospiraceae bacterium]|nr:hypothetical protein [Saprospiraceae bacterium]